MIITGARLQALMRGTVRRGRMTCTDAEELAQVVIQIGARQARDALAALGGIVDRSVDRARRAAGL